MRVCLAVVLIPLFVAGCATPLSEPSSVAGAGASSKKQCAEAVTGSRIPRCDQGSVKVINRDEIERAGATATGSTSAPMIRQ